MFVDAAFDELPDGFDVVELVEVEPLLRKDRHQASIIELLWQRRPACVTEENRAGASV